MAIFHRDVYIPAHQDAAEQARLERKAAKAAEAAARKAKKKEARVAAKMARQQNAGDFWGRRWNTQAEHARTRPRPMARSRPIFCFTFWLAVALALPKLMELGPIKESTVIGLGKYAFDFAIAIHADIVFATVVGLIGWMMMYATTSLPLGRKLLWLVWCLACVFCVLYGAVSANETHGMHSAMTLGILQADGLNPIIASIASMPLQAMLTLVLGVPLIYLITASGVAWIFDRFFAGGRRPLKIMLILMIAIYAHFASIVASTQWASRSERYVPENPHWVFIRSVANAAAPSLRLSSAAD